MNVSSIIEKLHDRDPRAIARAITVVEDNAPQAEDILSSLDRSRIDHALVVGFTGPPGAGKSTLTNQLIKVCRAGGSRVGVIAIDPSSSLSGGAVLGDRIRMMEHATDPDVVVRSMASRGRLGGLCAAAGAVSRVMAASGCDIVIIETVGVGQLEMDIARLADITTLVLAPGLGDEIQAMKAGVLEIADLIVVNKADLPGSDNLMMDLQALRSDGLAILSTTAVNGDNVVELYETLTALDKEQQENGSRRQRRHDGAVLEIIDWAMDMVRPIIKERAVFLQQTDDPRQAARLLVDGFLHEKE